VEDELELDVEDELEELELELELVTGVSPPQAVRPRAINSTLPQRRDCFFNKWMVMVRVLNLVMFY